MGELKEPKEAFYLYTKAISLKPELAYLYLNRGNILMSFQMMDEAISDFNTALKYEKDDTLIRAAYLNRGAAKMLKQDYEGGYKDLSYAYALDTNNKTVLINLAMASSQLNKKDEALKYLLMAHKAFPDMAGINSNLGFVYQSMGEYKKSIEYFDLTVKMDPKEALGYSNRSYSLLKLGDTDRAMKDINKSIELYPGNSYAYRNRALIWLELKKYADACEDLRTAIAKGYTEMYGKDVLEMIDKNCALFK